MVMTRLLAVSTSLSPPHPNNIGLVVQKCCWQSGDAPVAFKAPKGIQAMKKNQLEMVS